jgi:predicted aspartyl protease
MQRLLPWTLMIVVLFLSACESSGTRDMRLKELVREQERLALAKEEKPSIPGLLYQQDLFIKSTQVDIAGFNIQNRHDLTDNSFEKLDEQLAAFQKTLNDTAQRIAAAEEYISRHPDSYLPSEIGAFEELKKDYLKSKNRYDLRVKFFEPYKAEFAVEKRRSEARKAKFKQVVLDFIKVKNIPPESILVTDDWIFYIDEAVLKNGKISIRSHLSLLPDCQSSLRLPVHAFHNGQNLGQVVSHLETDIRRPWQTRSGSSGGSSGRNFDYTQVINIEDISIPPTGILELLVETGTDSSATVHANYSGVELPKVVIGSTIVLQGRREGGHLYLPVQFQTEGKSVTHECLVDTGATITTVPKSILKISTEEEGQFSTANGLVKLPVASSMVTVGAIAKELRIALSSDNDTALLGANFFEGFVYTIDLENSAVYLVKR